jgi:uncharacterized protein YqcC (DUF446 family)
MSELHRDLAARLQQLELEMRRLRLWSEERPSPEALASRQPFCIDTLNFVQWLQHVFLPSLRDSIDRGDTLPEKCAVAPMAQMYFMQLRPQRDIDAAILLAVLQGIDTSLSAPRPRR